VGRHTADDGAGVDPIVAAALRRRPTATEPGAPRHDPEFRQPQLTGDGGLGWPGEPGDGTGLGWPIDDDGQAGSPTEVSPVALAPEPGRRRGWRRLFGSAA
jgi:hypothetical protein